MAQANLHISNMFRVNSQEFLICLGAVCEIGHMMPYRGIEFQSRLYHSYWQVSVILAR